VKPPRCKINPFVTCASEATAAAAAKSPQHKPTIRLDLDTQWPMTSQTISTSGDCHIHGKSYQTTRDGKQESKISGCELGPGGKLQLNEYTFSTEGIYYNKRRIADGPPPYVRTSFELRDNSLFVNGTLVCEGVEPLYMRQWGTTSECCIPAIAVLLLLLYCSL
jgi:hypothetical protein